MTSYFFNTILCLSLLSCLLASSQEGTEFTIEKSAAVNYAITPRWNIQGGTTYRNTLTESLSNEAIAWNSKHIQFSANTAYEVGFYGKLGGGILYRFNSIETKDNENEVRLTQQYSYAKRYNGFRIGHRIKLDQRLRTSKNTHRIRYRISSDFPLNGESLDVGELYAVLSTESIFNTGKKESPAWDQRFTIGLGNQLFKKVKLQLNAQYRFENYLISTQNRLFVTTQLYYKL